MSESDFFDIDFNFLQRSFNAIPEAIIIADLEHRIVSVNKSFYEVFGYTKQDVFNKQISVLYESEDNFEQIGKTTYNEQSEVDSIIYEIEYQRSNGDVFWAETVATIIEGEDGEAIGYLRAIRDLTVNENRNHELKLLTKRLRLLAEILLGEKQNPDRKIQQALKLTTDMLGFEIGIVSQIKDNTYIIDHYYPSEIDLEKGMQFELGNTYCSIVVEANDVIGIEHAKNSSYQGHPYYQNFKLKSYLGTPLTINGKIYGTINFSSTQPVASIDQIDKDIIRLLGKWISSLQERRKIQKKLYESNKKYRLISENTADLVCLHEPDGTYEYISPSVENILGYTQNELIGTNHYELVHPKDVKKIYQKSKLETAGNTNTQITQYRIQKKSGKYIWFETATKAIVDDNGNVTKLRTGSRDINERKRIELLLKDTNRLATVGGWEVEIESGDIFWTDEVYRIHELPVGTDLEVDKAINFYAPEDRPIIQDKITRAIEEARGYDVELTLITAKGNRKWVRAIGKVQTDEDGKAYKLYGVFQDLTKRKKIEDQIKERNDELKKLIRATNKINSIIGHDLKTPLNTIIGFSDLLQKDLEKKSSEMPQMHKFSKLIFQASKNMSRLLDDLFRWSRLQTGNSSVTLTKLSIQVIIQNVISLLSYTANQKGISLKSYSDKQMEVMADKRIITTIIRNFVSNALKFSNAGDSIKITYGTRGEHWYISVKDEGEGMSKDVQSRLFDPEEHPSKRGTNNEKGAGIGLRLCNQLAKLHGGSINVKSEFGTGSEFLLIIPFKVEVGNIDPNKEP